MHVSMPYLRLYAKAIMVQTRDVFGSSTNMYLLCKILRVLVLNGIMVLTCSTLVNTHGRCYGGFCKSNCILKLCCLLLFSH
jgi:hypothetical protein